MTTKSRGRRRFSGARETALTKRESWVHDEDVCVGGQGKREMGSAVSPTLRNKKDDGLK